jgi:hypothetical protein
MADALFKTYEAIGNREDLTDIIANISPTETPMLSRFGKAKASNTLHEWQTDALSSASGAGVVEGSDVETTALTATARVGSYTQISQRKFRVSNTTQAMNPAGRANEYTYQMSKALKELATDMELSLHDNTGFSGNATAARTLKGVRAAVTTNLVTADATGSTSALSRDQINTLLRTIWAQGGNPNAIYVNGRQKERIGALTTPITRNIDASTKRFTSVVNVYDSDYGQLDIILDRYATTTEVLALQENQFKVAYLRPVHSQPLPDNGGGPKGKVEAEYTLQYGNEKASGKITGLSAA